MHERRLARAHDLQLAEREKDARERAGVVERAVRHTGIDAEARGEVAELGAPRVELARERQRVVGAELRRPSVARRRGKSN